MTKQKPERQPGASAPADSEPDVVQRIEEQLAGASDGPTPQPQGPGDQAGGDREAPPQGGDSSDVIEVDIGDGVIQRVPKSELSQLVAERSRIDEMRRAAESVLARNSSAAQLVQQLEQMDPEIRTRVFEVLQDPSRLVQQRQQAGQDDEDFSMESVLGSNGQQQNAAESRELDELRKQVGAITEYVKGQIGKDQQAQLNQRVDQTMEGFDVFGESRAGSDFARQAILTEMAANPRADLQQVVAKHAVNLHKFLQERPATPPPRDSRGRYASPPTVEAPEEPPSGDDLMSGNLAERLTRQLYGGT